MAVLQKHGLLSVLVPSLLPPPVPFKIFVLAAGVAGVRPVDFLWPSRSAAAFATSAKGCSRCGTANRPPTFMRDNAKPIGLGLAVAALVLGRADLVTAWIDVPIAQHSSARIGSASIFRPI